MANDIMAGLTMFFLLIVWCWAVKKVFEWFY